MMVLKSLIRITVVRVIVKKKNFVGIKNWISITNKSPFTREENRVLTRGKSGTGSTVLDVYTDDNLPRVGQKMG